MVISAFKPNIIKKAVTQLGKPAALLPVVLLEATTDIGRCKQGYDKKGKTELIERIVEEGSSGVFWLFGASMFNKLGDYVGKKFLKIKQPVFSTGVDKARDCMKQGFMANKDKSKKMLAAFKFSKVVLSIVAAVGVVGFGLPKIKQAITRHLEKKNKNKNVNSTPTETSINYTQKAFSDFTSFKRGKKQSNPSFGGHISAETLGRLAHNFENNTTYKLGATDGGILLGRTTTSRTLDEAARYGFRDALSSYFYLFSTAHVFKLLNKIDKYKGKNTGIDPSSAVHVNRCLEKVLDGKSMPVEEFERKVFGKFDESKYNLIKETLEKNKGNISVEDFCQLTSADKELTKKARLMSRLQPKLNGVSILTDKQAVDVLTDGALSDPKFLYRTTNGYFGEASKKLFGKNKGKFSISGIRDKFRFISIKDIEEQRSKISDYAQSVVEMAKNQAKKSNSVAEVSMNVLKKASRRNSIFHSAYLGAALGVSILFLSTIIPRTQYLISGKKDNKTEKAA